MSLEVGEHLPPQFEDIFIQNLHNNNKHGIVLSWAVKGQGGHGHFNEQNNDYVKSKICDLGYVNDVKSENILSEGFYFVVVQKYNHGFQKIGVLKNRCNIYNGCILCPSELLHHCRPTHIVCLLGYTRPYALLDPPSPSFGLFSNVL